MPKETALTTFRPETEGQHGSQALWSAFDDSDAYWSAVEAFLQRWQSLPRFLTLSPQGELRVDAPSPWLLERSSDLRTWQGVGGGSANAPPAQEQLTLTSSAQFFRLRVVDTLPLADVVSVSAQPTASGTRFAVGISSPETGCAQYADWWEILDTDGQLLYRRILAHSHVTEQPFVRTGTVRVNADDILWIRAHMNAHGYGGQAFHGSVNGGFQSAELSPLFAIDVAEEDPLPTGCAF